MVISDIAGPYVWRLPSKALKCALTHVPSVSVTAVLSSCRIEVSCAIGLIRLNVSFFAEDQPPSRSAGSGAAGRFILSDVVRQERSVYRTYGLLSSQSSLKSRRGSFSTRTSLSKIIVARVSGL